MMRSLWFFFLALGLSCQPDEKMEKDEEEEEEEESAGGGSGGGEFDDLDYDECGEDLGLFDMEDVDLPLDGTWSTNAISCNVVGEADDSCESEDYGQAFVALLLDDLSSTVAEMADPLGLDCSSGVETVCGPLSDEATSELGHDGYCCYVFEFKVECEQDWF
jgi:hypothetical protein